MVAGKLSLYAVSGRMKAAHPYRLSLLTSV